MNTAMLDLLQNKFKLDFSQKLPIEIPDFGRNQLADLFKELNFNLGVEVGVSQGHYSKILIQANPDLKLYGVDPYEPHSGYRDYTHQTTFNRLNETAHQQLDQFTNYTFVPKYSMEAVKDFTDNSLDFVYIDGDHSFQSVTNDIAEWSKKVRKGGIISGHDYARQKDNARVHVVQVVNAYTSAWNIRPWFVLGRQAKGEGLIRDDIRSWMWVKQ